MSEPKPKSFVISKRAVWEAWLRVKANKGAPGVDEQSIEEFEQDLNGNLFKLWNRLSSGSFFPPPVRAVEIPKKDGGLRVLGVPTVADRIAQTVACAYLEPRVEPLFHHDSYGYRPGRSAHDALGVCRERCWRNDWVLDLDIRKFLVPSSHCHRVHGGGVEEGVCCGNPDAEAFSASVADVDGLELAALDTLQHGLAGDAEGAHGVDDREVAGGGVFDEEGAELVVDPDPPGCAGGVLLAGDEAGLEPAVDG
jgi:hypothetical protein